MRHGLCWAALALGCLVLLASMPVADAQASGLGKTPARIAIVNQISGHLEVVCGVISLLRDYSIHPLTVFLHPRIIQNNSLGFFDWFGRPPNVVFKMSKEYYRDKYDFVWFVSPEYGVKHVHSFVRFTKPKVAVLMVHNGIVETLDGLLKTQELFPGLDMHLSALSPHVRDFVANRTGRKDVEWMLPIHHFQSGNMCAHGAPLHGCIRGFAVQGRIESSRRNYTRIWEQITAATASGALRNGDQRSSDFQLNIIGQRVEEFVVPSHVSAYVNVVSNPLYPQFYDVVHKSYALVPMLASPHYFSFKFSSTVLTALITGVPLLADSRMMRAYAMLENGAVFLQGDNESELDAVLRVLQLPEAEIWARRKAMHELGDKLNGLAGGLVRKWIQAVEPQLEHTRRRGRS